MNDYSTLRYLLTEYDCLQNVERGWNGAKVEAAYQRVKLECERLSVTVAEGRRLAMGYPITKQVEVHGPAYVAAQSFDFTVYHSREAMEAAPKTPFTSQSFIPAGRSLFFTARA